MRKPEEMTAEQRKEEVAEILGRGIVRVNLLKARKNKGFPHNSLDSGAEESVYATEP